MCVLDIDEQRSGNTKCCFGQDITSGTTLDATRIACNCCGSVVSLFPVLFSLASHRRRSFTTLCFRASRSKALDKIIADSVKVPVRSRYGSSFIIPVFVSCTVISFAEVHAALCSIVMYKVCRGCARQKYNGSSHNLTAATRRVIGHLRCENSF